MNKVAQIIMIQLEVVMFLIIKLQIRFKIETFSGTTTMEHISQLKNKPVKMTLPHSELLIPHFLWVHHKLTMINKVQMG